jgi:hypothetical protein
VKPLGIVKAAELFGPRNETSTVSPFGLTFGEEVHVIRHEAIGNDCKVFAFSGAQYLRTNQVERFSGYEDSLAIACAKRKEISLEAKVVEAFQVSRSTSAHAADAARRAPGEKSSV